MACAATVPFRTFIGRAILGALILFTALASVGLTAPQDGPFSIDIRPEFLRLDPTAVAESRARAFGLDVDIKLGALHMHIGWSAIPLMPTTTKAPGSKL